MDEPDIRLCNFLCVRISYVRTPECIRSWMGCADQQNIKRQSANEWTEFDAIHSSPDLFGLLFRSDVRCMDFGIKDEQIKVLQPNSGPTPLVYTNPAGAEICIEICIDLALLREYR